jgi:hypothetical protein
MKFTILLPILILTLFLGVYAQDGKSPGAARVKGTITDIYGASLPMVRIKAKDLDGKIFHAKLLNGRDVYELALPHGSYTISFELLPFKPFEVRDYQVGYDRIQNLDVILVCGEGCEEIEDIATPEKETLQERDDRGSALKKNLRQNNKKN